MAKVDINTKMITLLGDPLKQSFADRCRIVVMKPQD